MTLDCKDIGVNKSEFVAKTQVLYLTLYLKIWPIISTDTEYIFDTEIF